MTGGLHFLVEDEVVEKPGTLIEPEALEGVVDLVGGKIWVGLMEEAKVWDEVVEMGEGKAIDGVLLRKVPDDRAHPRNGRSLNFAFEGTAGTGSDTMRIAVSSTGTELSSPVDERFGRCAYFVIFDDRSQKGTVIVNGSRNAPHGAGIQAAQLLVDRKVKMALSGHLGPKAQEVLDRAGIKAITGISGTVEEALESACQGRFNPNVPFTMNK